MFAKKPEIDKNAIKELIIHLNEENDNSQKRIENKFELKSIYEQQIHEDNQMIKELFPENTHQILEQVTIKRTELNLEGVEYDVKNLRMDIENRISMIIVLEKFLKSSNTTAS